MKFKLSLTGHFYKENEIKKYEELGFTFAELDGTFLGNTHSLIDTNENLESIYPEIEISSLEELEKFTKDYGEIILYNNTIEIYNDYRE